MKKKEIRSAALDIIFSVIIYDLFLDKLAMWAVNNETIRRYFPSRTYPGMSHWAVDLVFPAAAFVVLILYIKLLADAELKDYYLSGPPKFRWFIFGLLSAAIYAGVVLLVLPGEWSVHIGESLLSSFLSAVWVGARRYLSYGWYFSVIVAAGMFYGALRRRMSRLPALIGVWVLATVLSCDKLESILDIAEWVFTGIWVAALGMIAEYTRSVWSAVLYDAPIHILMSLNSVFKFVYSYTPPHSDDLKILFFHQAASPNRALNRLVIGLNTVDSIPMAIIHLLLIAYLYAKIRKREANPVIENNSGDSSR
ncbi:MAG: hypothetical protein IKI12_01200 [Lachnospiraceae bacterium]|nr:hypothetical protein [Lachnospiraceae bacterium]